MLLVLKLTATGIQRKLSLRSVNKMKEIIFELNKMKVIFWKPLQINYRKLKKKSHQDKHDMDMRKNSL